MIETINFFESDLNTAKIEDLIIIDIQLKNILARKEEYDYSIDFLEKFQSKTAERIKVKIRAHKKAELRKLKAQREALLPDDVKLKQTEEKIAELEKSLAINE